MSAYQYRFLQVEVSPEGYAVVRICKEPVNSMSLELWSELDRCLHELEADSRNLKGVVLASGVRRPLFTAGNDLNELYAKKTTKARFTDFWRAQTHFLAHLNSTKLVTVAAIKGACPAGGCITALSCDYRIMTEEKGYIGLNEVLIGLPVPKLWCKLMERNIGAKYAHSALMTGKMFKPREALAVGLVDELAPEPDLLARAEGVIKKWAKLPHFGVSTTKRFLKDEIANEMFEFCDEEAEQTWGILTSPAIVGLMESYIRRLAKKKAKL